jgi:hypothetical protein
MTDQPKNPADETPQCFLCDNTDQQIALVRVLFQGRKQWVCAHCLPVLIHGPQ